MIPTFKISQKLLQSKLKKYIFKHNIYCGGGQVVSEPTFNSDDLSSNPTVFVLEKEGK